MRDSDRRAVLRRVGSATTVGLAGIFGSQSATQAAETNGISEFDRDQYDDEELRDTVSRTIDIQGPGVQDKAAFEERRDAMTEGTDPIKNNLEYLDHVEHETTLSASGLKIADVELLLTAYEAIDDEGDPLTDSDGNYYYVLEYYAVSDEASRTGLPSGQTEELQVGAEVESNAIKHHRDPAQTSWVEGDWVTLEVGMTVGDYGFSIEDATWMDHGVFGPEYWTPGDGGEYKVMFDGETPGGDQFDILGYSSTSVDLWSPATSIWSIVDEWSWYAAGTL